MAHHQHAPQGAGGYGRSVEGGIGPELQPGGQQARVGGQQPGGPQAPPGDDGMQAGPQGGGQAQFGQSPAGGQQLGPAGQRPQEGPGAVLDDALSSSMRVALHDTIKSLRVCEWCADQCIDEGPGMERCIRLCRDVVDLARVNASFIVRDSIFGPEVARAFASAAEECARECGQHPHEHCQECARVLRRAARTTRELLATTGTQTAGQLPAGGQ